MCNRGPVGGAFQQKSPTLCILDRSFKARAVAVPFFVFVAFRGSRFPLAQRLALCELPHSSGPHHPDRIAHRREREIDAPGYLRRPLLVVAALERRGSVLANVLA